MMIVFFVFVSVSVSFCLVGCLFRFVCFVLFGLVCFYFASVCLVGWLVFGNRSFTSSLPQNSVAEAR